MSMIDLGGHEKAAADKMEASMAWCVEHTRERRYIATFDALRDAIEAATELGVYRQDPRWASVAMKLEEARTALTKLSAAAFGVHAPILGDMFASMRQRVAYLTHGKTRH